jgi:hypothetical protein
MQRWVAFVVLVLALGIAPAVALAQEAQAIEQPRRLDSMSQRDREREMQAEQWQGPSGFWTSPHKATHGAYRYRLMGIGGALLLGMGFFTYRLLKKASNDRDKRD